MLHDVVRIRSRKAAALEQVGDIALNAEIRFPVDWTNINTHLGHVLAVEEVLVLLQSNCAANCDLLAVNLTSTYVRAGVNAASRWSYRDSVIRVVKHNLDIGSQNR